MLRDDFLIIFIILNIRGWHLDLDIRVLSEGLLFCLWRAIIRGNWVLCCVEKIYRNIARGFYGCPNEVSEDRRCLLIDLSIYLGSCYIIESFIWYEGAINFVSWVDKLIFYFRVMRVELENKF